LGPHESMLQVALVDLRLGSPTFGPAQHHVPGGAAPLAGADSPGSDTGYKVIGGEEAVLVYMTDRFYNPRDEGAYLTMNASINYDWETQKK